MQKQSTFKSQWEGNKSYKPQLDLKKLLANPAYEARHLIVQNNIVDQISTNFKLFCSCACLRSDLIPDLVAIALRPDCYNINNNENHKKNLPFISFQIISILAQSTYFNVFEKYPVLHPSQFTFIDILFQTLSPQTNINETSLGYLSKLINQITYDQGYELLSYITSNKIPTIYSTIIKHINYTSVANILYSLLIIQNPGNQIQIFGLKKILIEQLFNSLSSTQDDILEDQLQSVGRLVENLRTNLMQKKKINCFQEDNIINLFVTKSNLSILMALVMQQTDSVIVACFEIIINLLHFEKELQKYPNPTREPDSKEGQKNIFPQTFEDRLIIWKYVSDGIVSNLLEVVFYKSTSSTASSKMKQTQLKLLMIIQNLITFDKTFAADILIPSFIKTNVELMDRFPFHNILHNCQKEILLSALTFDLELTICHPDTGLIEFIIRSLKRSRREIGFINQLFNIITSIEYIRAYNFNFSDFMLQYGEWSSALESYYIIEESYEQLLASENPVLDNELDACTALSLSPPASFSRYSAVSERKKFLYRSQKDNSFQHREDFNNNNYKVSKSPFSLHNNTKKKRHNTTQIDSSEMILMENSMKNSRQPDLKVYFPQIKEISRKKLSFCCDKIQIENQQDDQFILKDTHFDLSIIPIVNDDSFDANIQNMSPMSTKHKANTPTHHFLKNFEINITEEEDNNNNTDFMFFNDQDEDDLSVSHRNKSKKESRGWKQLPIWHQSSDENESLI